MEQHYADVILPLPVEGTYTYALPADFAAAVKVGCRLTVPFGSRKFYSAIVVKLHDVTPPYKTKEALELLDPEPLVLPVQLKLWRWIADYYLCTVGDVYKAALPAGLKLTSESIVMLEEEFQPSTPFSPSETKVFAALEEKPSQSISELLHQTALRNIIPVVKSMLAKGAVRMREEVRRTFKPRTLSYVRLAESYFDETRFNEALVQLKKSPRQSALLLRYAEMASFSTALKLQNYSLLKEISRQELLEASDCTPAVLRSLVDKGILEIWQKTVGRLSVNQIPGEMVTFPLSPSQQEAKEQIQKIWQQQDVCLLHGVTGSGKTEIYIHLIQEALARGEQVLYMLPEIVLTAQLTDRLKRVFGDRLGVYHSRYPDAERVEVYQKMLSDSPYDIIVGVRSSIFLPFKNLGMIIIDEEHESSFKQQDPAPRYHARNAALVLAAQAGAKTLMGTATPSLESYYNARRGKYGLVKLQTRFRDMQLPRIEVVDMRMLRKRKEMTGPFSPMLLDAIGNALKQNQQIILFQNRRGFSPVQECSECGWTPRCQKCDVSLTYHRSARQMVCHYCGTTYPIPQTCPNCGNADLRNRGYGTERIEEQLQEFFPQARIARMDLDTTGSRQNYERLLHDFQHGATDILVGTQMVTKGLDFDRVSVVGILNAGTMLSQPDFRSYERAFSMMEQVAGRAGRKNAQGHVILQTMDTEASVIRQVVNHDYEAMYEEQLAERELFLYPPFCRLIYIYLKHRDEQLLERLSADATALLRSIFGERVLGPDTPPVGWVQNMHIRQLILKVELSLSIADVRSRLRQVQSHLLSQPHYASVRFYYDVD